MKTGPCPKCDGRGTIDAFRGVAGGVCFLCGGRKVVTIDPAKQQVNTEAAAETARKRAWLLKATAAELDALPWEKLYRAWTFASACVGEGEKKMVPVWRDLKARVERAAG